MGYGLWVVRDGLWVMGYEVSFSGGGRKDRM